MPDDTPAPLNLDAIQRALDDVLPIGYVVTALIPAHTDAQIDTLTTILYEYAPALLAEVERLRAENDQARAWLAPFMDWGEPRGDARP
jgi:hypothetical protein